MFETNKNIIKNYGILIRYDSRSNTHTMYKEFRDVSLVGAIEKMYSDMAARHRARKSSIQIVNTQVIKSADVKRPALLQYLVSLLSVFSLPDTVLTPFVTEIQAQIPSAPPPSSCFLQEVRHHLQVQTPQHLHALKGFVETPSSAVKRPLQNTSV